MVRQAKEFAYAAVVLFIVQRLAFTADIDHFSGPNFALHRFANQTPGDYGDLYAMLATDGNTDNDVVNRSCSYTNGTYNTPATWTVYFENPIFVKGIVIYNRKIEQRYPYLWKRLMNFKIYGDRYDILYSDVNFNHYNNLVIKIPVNASKAYSSVTIIIPGRENSDGDEGISYLTLCEVQVYAATCQTPVANEHVVVENVEYYYIVGMYITFHCKTGYKIAGRKSVTCIGDMQWSTLPNCTLVRCPNPGTFDNGYYRPLINCSSWNSSDLSYGCMIQPYCEDGFKLQTQLTRICNNNGEWSIPSPYCASVTCSHPGNFSHGQYIKNNSGIYITGPSNYATFIEAQCDEGYIINDKRQRTCTKDGTWSGGEPKCNIVKCSFEELGSLTSGHYVLNGQIFENGFANYMETAGVVCIKGYKPKTDKENATCMSDGTWSSQTSSCVIVTCLTPAETANMKFKTWYDTSHRNLSNALPLGAFVEVICQTGDLKNGSRIRQCRYDGSWDGGEPVCDIERRESEMFQTATIGGAVGGSVIIIIIVAVVLSVVIYKKRHADANSERSEDAAIYTELRKSQLNTTEYGQIFQTGTLQDHPMSTGSRNMERMEETSLQSTNDTYCNTTISTIKNDYINFSS